MATSLDDISALVSKLIETDEKIERMEEKVKQVKEYARVLREETIPSIMQELELKTLETSNGKEIKIKQEVYVSIPADNKDSVYAWLKEHDFDGIIKTKVTVEYGRGELRKAETLQRALEKNNLQASLTQDIHCKTLQAFVKEQITAGNEIPLELFGARPTWKTVIK